METPGDRVKKYVDQYARVKAGDSAVNRIEKLRREKAAEIEAIRQENTRKAVGEINQFGDSLEFGNLIARYANIAGNRHATDDERATGAVAYAALYPTFGHQGISQIISAWENTGAIRKNATD